MWLRGGVWVHTGGAQVWVLGMKLSFVCVSGGEKARAGTLFCLGLGAETRGTLLTQAAAIEKWERGREMGRDLGGEVFPFLLATWPLQFAKHFLSSTSIHPCETGQELFLFSGLVD